MCVAIYIANEGQTPPANTRRCFWGLQLCGGFVGCGKGASFVSPKCFHGASGASTAVSQDRRASPSLRHSGQASPIGCPAAEPDVFGIENAMLLSAVSNPHSCLGPLPARRLVARCMARTRLMHRAFVPSSGLPWLFQTGPCSPNPSISPGTAESPSWPCLQCNSNSTWPLAVYGRESEPALAVLATMAT